MHALRCMRGSRSCGSHSATLTSVLLSGGRQWLGESHQVAQWLCYAVSVTSLRAWLDSHLPLIKRWWYVPRSDSCGNTRRAIRSDNCLLAARDFFFLSASRFLASYIHWSALIRKPWVEALTRVVSLGSASLAAGGGDMSNVTLLLEATGGSPAGEAFPFFRPD